MMRKGDSSRGVGVTLLADTGVRRTILNPRDWEKLEGGEQKETLLRFTNQYLGTHKKNREN